eukprot:6186986-Pleurochrysis_carterae.AAC.3
MKVDGNYSASSLARSGLLMKCLGLCLKLGAIPCFRSWAGESFGTKGCSSVRSSHGPKHSTFSKSRAHCVHVMTCLHFYVGQGEADNGRSSLSGWLAKNRAAFEFLACL